MYKKEESASFSANWLLLSPDVRLCRADIGIGVFLNFGVW
jgi:hypothetical protein